MCQSDQIELLALIKVVNLVATPMSMTHLSLLAMKFKSPPLILPARLAKLSTHMPLPVVCALCFLPLVCPQVLALCLGALSPHLKLCPLR